MLQTETYWYPYFSRRPYIVHILINSLLWFRSFRFKSAFIERDKFVFCLVKTLLLLTYSISLFSSFQVEKDESFLQAIREATEEQLFNANKDKKEGEKKTEESTVRERVEARAKKIIRDISSAMSNNVLK